MTTTTLALSTPVAASSASASASSSSSFNRSSSSLSFAETNRTISLLSRRMISGLRKSRRRTIISCEVATSSTPLSASSSSEAEGEGEFDGGLKIGSRVRVSVPLKVYHVPRVPEIDLTGMEGRLKLYVGLWKGKKISANLPYKIEFVTEIEGRGPVKFFAHLKDDEFEVLD